MNVASNPYYVGPAKNPVNAQLSVKDQELKYKDDEKFQKAPNSNRLLLLLEIHSYH